MTPVASGPTSAYLRRGIRSLQQACRDIHQARGGDPPCDACGVADICSNNPARNSCTTGSGRRTRLPRKRSGR